MKKILIAACLALLAGCSTVSAPERRAEAPPPARITNPLTVAAEAEAAAKFGSTAMKPGEYKVLPKAAIPAKGSGSSTGASDPNASGAPVAAIERHA